MCILVQKGLHGTPTIQAGFAVGQSSADAAAVNNVESKSSRFNIVEPKDC